MGLSGEFRGAFLVSLVQAGSNELALKRGLGEGRCVLPRVDLT